MRWGYDVEEAREKLQEYKDTDRADFESAEEYSEARADAWQEFVDSIDTISKEEEPEEKVTIKQLTQAAIKLLTTEAKAYAKELAKIKGKDPRKDFIFKLWDTENRRHPDSLASQAYIELIISQH